MFQLQTKQNSGFLLQDGNDVKLVKYASDCLSMFSREKEISRGAFYVAAKDDGKEILQLVCSFASPEISDDVVKLEIGEGLPGQVARDGKMMIISDIPGEYFIISGLGKALPQSVMIFPVRSGEKILAVIELASFHKFREDDRQYFTEISMTMADRLKSLRSFS